MPLFYRSPLTYANSKGFEVVYDNAGVVGLFGELKLNTSIGLDLAAFAEYNKYNMKELSHAFHRPELQTGVIVSYNWKEKIVLTTNITYIGERTAFEHSLFENGVTTEYPILAGYTDVRLGAEYRYNKNLSAFFNVTNLLSQNYEIWYGYPVQQIQFLVGLSYRF
ncbi:MAG: TonB-dependent receptor, partial [Schleiferiaceae bacterium]|nr:TonB-dependent receptor [Schleiferiaceae bacterium]